MSSPPEGTNSSLSTVLLIVSSMIGGSVLVYPLLFKNAGLLTCTAVLLLSALIAYKTCRINVIHSARDDKDIEDTILRILGARWQNFFTVLSGYYFVILNVIYVQLIVDQAYGMLYYAVTSAGRPDLIADKTVRELVFDRISLQYLSLALFFPLLALIFVKDLRLVMKLGEFGIGAVFIYVAFLGYEFFSKAATIDYSLVKWWSWDVGPIAGTCAFSLVIHTFVNAMIKLHKFPQKNETVLKVSFFCGCLVFLSVGVVGSLIILDKNEGCKVTIMNCFKDSWEILFVEFSSLYGMVTVFPCFLAIGRRRLMGYHFPATPEKHVAAFNVAFMGVAIGCSFFSQFLTIDLVMSLVGAVVCYFFIYVIPTFLHFQCLHPRRLQPPNSSQHSLLSSSQVSEGEYSRGGQECLHQKEEGKRSSKAGRVVFYGVVNLLGVAVMGYNLWQTISNLIEGE